MAAGLNSHRLFVMSQKIFINLDVYSRKLINRANFRDGWNPPPLSSKMKISNEKFPRFPESYEPK